MTAFQWTILSLSLIEILLLGIVTLIFLRLRRSEDLLARLRQNQAELLDKLALSEQMEKDLVNSFAERQEELTRLDRRLRERAQELKALLEQSEKLVASPAQLRQAVLAGHGRGKSVQELSRSTGLTPEEVAVILEQNRNR